MTTSESIYRVGDVDVTRVELMVLMVFDTAIWNDHYGKSGEPIVGFAKTSTMIRLIKFYYQSTEKNAEIIIRSVGNKLFNTEKGKSDNLKKFYPGHGVFLKDEFIKDFGCGKGIFKLGDSHFHDDCKLYVVDGAEIKKPAIFKTQDTTKKIAPEPPPDMRGDVHLMAMTILEKLQPVLLNAIYTELMEHKK